MRETTPESTKEYAKTVTELIKAQLTVFKTMGAIVPADVAMITLVATSIQMGVSMAELGLSVADMWDMVAEEEDEFGN
mgnify:CR=1 FL=1